MITGEEHNKTGRRGLTLKMLSWNLGLGTESKIGKSDSVWLRVNERCTINHILTMVTEVYLTLR
jgi:hypothetical protein